MKVYILWKVDEDDLYPVDSEIVGVYISAASAEKQKAEMPPQYLKSYAITEHEVRP